MYLFTTGTLLLLAIFGCPRIASTALEDSSIGQLSETDHDPNGHDRFTRGSHCARPRSDICGPYTSSPPLGSLKVNVKRATALPDKDGFLKSDSDPYVMVSAVTGTSRVTRNTKVVKNSNDPTWNEKLWIGCGRWKYIDVSVWDSDGGGDELLMPVMNFNTGTGKCSITHCNGDSTLYFDIELTPDGNECSPNPCLNGGTCTDRACGFRCTCPGEYYGTYCEYKSNTYNPCKHQLQADQLVPDPSVEC